MGDSIDSSNIDYDLIGRRIVMSSPYFSTNKEYRRGIVRYIESSQNPTKVALDEDGSSSLEIVDFNSYRNIELKD